MCVRDCFAARVEGARTQDVCRFSAAANTTGRQRRPVYINKFPEYLNL